MKLQMGGKTGAWLLRAGLQTFAAVMAVCLAGASAGAVGADLGTWMNSEQKGKIQLRECGEDGLCGNIVWLKDPVDENGKPWRDMLNPDPKLRNRPVIGLDVLIGAKKIGPMTWQGQIYDPEVGKVYYLKHLKIGSKQVEIKGCLSTGWPCRTKYWSKTEPVTPAEPEMVTAKKTQPRSKPAPRPVARAKTPPPAPAAPPPAPVTIPRQAQPPAAPPPVQTARRAPPPAQVTRPAPPPAQVARPAAPRRPEVTAALPREIRPTSGGYLVQVAARQSHTEALRAFDELQRRYPQLLGGLSPEVLQADLGQRGIWYRVGVGPMLQQQAAADFCNQLKNAGADCLIRRR
jgi:uncharacterized protein (DUF2147 family)